MRKFPEPIQNLTAAFTQLPGVGPKTALRYVYALLKFPKPQIKFFAKLLEELSEKILICKTCCMYTESELCPFCADQRRDDSILCVVELSRDIATIESTEMYQGRYFVFGGTLNPLEGQTPETLNMQRLLSYLHTHPNIQEIILAFSPDISGETTMMYLSKHLKPFSKHLTRLARGLPTGAALEFADEITLADALKGRREM